MVETTGANRGITPTMREGIKGQSIRYNTDDGISEDYSSPKDTRRRYEAMGRAKISDIAHYLGDDWIDWDVVKFSVNDTSRNKIETFSKVFRCILCGEAYQTKSITSSGKSLGTSILKTSMFNKIPMQKGECGLCG